ncbi:hypothetical protein BDV12DRAFT_3710 [Aspergillus spectabilis]
MATCFHKDSPDLLPPSASQAVYREDCTQCFDSIDDEPGLNVCLSCFNGGCAGPREHARLHYERFGHPLALNIRRTRKTIQREEPPQKISKLAINAETDEDRYDTRTHVVCYACGQDDIDKSSSRLKSVIGGVMNAMTFSKKEEIKAWEQEFVPCEHTLGLVQQQPKNIESQDLGQCSMCDLKQNLWLCLECGNLGCGRSQFGGTGGNSHGLAHFDATFHAVAVKLGSITADGSADIYCYKCNEERVDPDLATHLAHWGINLSSREKTEKSLMEMQVEQNLKWDFTMTAGDGHGLNPVFGAGLTGLSNLGNSCYLSSVVQCLFDLPEFQRRYYHPDEKPPFSEAPASDFETQLRKLADGTLSGRYSRPDDKTLASPEPQEVLHQRGLAPSMFKHLIGRDHAEFSTMRQQDAFEFLLHVFKHVTMSKHPVGLSNPIESFRFSMEQRLQCLNCKKVRYRLDEQDNISIPVPARRAACPNDTSPSGSFESVALTECLDVFTAEETVDLRCTSCDSQERFSKRSAFRTMPAELVINARRFELINWVPTKLDIPVEVNDEPVDLSPYLSAGPGESEEILPENEASDGGFEANADLLGQLLGMGFPRVRCEKSLYSTGNSDLEAAMNWLLSHMEDPDIDEPMTKKQGSVTRAGQADADPAKVMQLNEMGIEDSHAKRALAATGGDITRAIDWVFSHPGEIGESAVEQQSSGNTEAPATTPGFHTTPAIYQLRSIICHKGSSVHAGHYVAFVRKHLPGRSGLSWVMFNDEKVVEVNDVQEMKKFAYLYFFSRV